MKTNFYPKLAFEGIRKNKRLYLPYIVTGAVMVMMYYILSFLAESEVLEHIKGGGMLRRILPLGTVVVAVFSLIFLFYSNSFLIRQRNKEFGLYNVLGMDKGNLGRIMFWENIAVGVISILGGLVLGIAFSKMAELGMLNILNHELVYTLQIDMGSVLKAVSLFGGIYLVLLLNSVIKVRHSNPLELLHSNRVGEKPPKANWLFAILGVGLLTYAYYIAVSIEQPLSAIVWFFVAVVLVIIATYLLFIAGSVVFCRILQKNRGYYYTANHFVSVSSMVYRMKRNGAGLASICILVTMVLIMLSSTLSLYVGAEDSLAQRYPKDIALRLSIPTMEQMNEQNFSQMRNAIQERVPNQENVVEYTNAEVAGLFTENGIIIDQKSYMESNTVDYDKIGYLQIMTLEDYNRVMGTNVVLEKDECLLHCLRTEYMGDTFCIEGGTPLKVKEVLDDMYIAGYSSMKIVPTITLITADFNTVVSPMLSLENSLGDPVVYFGWNYSFDMDTSAEEEIAAYDLLRSEMDHIVIREEDGSYSYIHDCREAGRAEFFGLYGGLFFIGILLSIVFVFATVIIIYYKQISEGYEDQKRFEIMQKVGMTKKEIRRSINSQILTVFFLPLVFAGMHLAFAFPMVWKLLQLFNLYNLPLLIGVTIVCFLVFGVCYALVYKWTAGAYYKIVSGAKES